MKTLNAVVVGAVAISLVRTLLGQDIELKDSYPAETGHRLLNHSPERQGDERYVEIKTCKNGFSVIKSSASLFTQYFPALKLTVDADDFPALKNTGLHDDETLKNTTRITGRAVDEITSLAKPGQLSSDGFLAEDEDLISVMLGDNKLVAKMGLRHFDLAATLIDFWNVVGREQEAKAGEWLGRGGHVFKNIAYFYYNGHEIHYKAEFSKGGQRSIFNEDFTVGAHSDIWIKMSQSDSLYLERSYSHLSQAARSELRQKLSKLLTGEIHPYYIYRYGFYEGHTGWRTDPVVLSYVFGLKPLAELDACFDGRLDEILTRHFTGNN